MPVRQVNSNEKSIILNNPKSSFGSRFISFNIFAKRVGSSYRKYSTDLISLFSEFAKKWLNSSKLPINRKWWVPESYDSPKNMITRNLHCPKSRNCWTDSGDGEYLEYLSTCWFNDCIAAALLFGAVETALLLNWRILNLMFSYSTSTCYSLYSS